MVYGVVVTAVTFGWEIGGGPSISQGHGIVEGGPLQCKAMILEGESCEPDGCSFLLG